MDFLPKDPAILVSSVNMLLRDEAISDGRSDFLRDHKRFGDDITLAVERLEKLL
jgi:hypothetical protein